MQVTAALREYSHDLFISYSRRNESFAARLEKTLESYRPPKELDSSRRYLDVFRDRADFVAGEYSLSLNRHLKDSARLIVICSPEARASRYVDEEIRRFVAVRGADHIIPVLLSGIPNNEAKPDQEAQMAFPQALCDVMPMPLAVDYRAFEGEAKVDRAPFSDAWYSLLANVYSVSRGEIEQRERKRRARTRRIVFGVLVGSIAVLSVFLYLAIVARNEAERQRSLTEEQTRIAEERARIATARQLAAEAMAASDFTSATGAYGTLDTQRSVLLAVESLRRFHTVEGTKALRDAIDRLRGDAPQIRFSENGLIGDYSLSPDGRTLAVVQNDRIRVRNLDGSGDAGWTIASEEPLSSVFSLDGSQLAVFFRNSTSIWDVVERVELQSIDSAGGTLENILDTESSLLISLSESGVRIRDLRSQTVRWIVPEGEGWTQSALSPGGKWLAVQDGEGIVRVFDIATGHETGRSAIEGAYLLGISRDGSLVALATGTDVDVWRVAGWRRTARLPHEWAVQGLKFSRDGQWLTTVTGKVGMDAADLAPSFLPGSTIRVWELNTHRLVTQISLAQEGGFTSGPVTRPFAFGPDGDRIVTASDIVQPSAESEGAIETDGLKLISWLLLPTELVTEACSLLKRNLSSSEWSAFLGSEPFRPTCDGLPIPDE